MELTTKELAQNEVFCKALLHDNDEFIDVSELVVYALNEGWIDDAVTIFKTAIETPVIKSKELDDFINYIVNNCCSYDEYEPMETVRDYLMPIVAQLQDSRVRRHYADYETWVNDHIAYAKERAKRYKKLDFDNDVTGTIIEELLPKEKPALEDDSSIAEVERDCTIYTFCGVQLYPGSKIYAYRAENIAISIGDKVLVPIGDGGKESVAEVVSVGQYTRDAAPYPVDQAKFIKGKTMKKR